MNSTDFYSEKGINFCPKIRLKEAVIFVPVFLHLLCKRRFRASF